MTFPHVAFELVREGGPYGILGELDGDSMAVVVSILSPAEHHLGIVLSDAAHQLHAAICRVFLNLVLELAL